MLKKNRSYILAISALAAVFLAFPSASIPLVSEAHAAPATKKSELETQVEAAYQLVSKKKYDDAVKAFKAIKVGKYKDYISQNPRMAALLDYQIAACLIEQKKWSEAETALTTFLEKYPKDDQVMDVRLSLVNCYTQQENWEGARSAVDAVLKWLQSHPDQKLYIKATIARVELLRKEGAKKDKSGEKPPEGVESFEKMALATSVKALYDLTNNSIWSPEMISARQELMSVYRALGRKNEANALKAKVDAYLSGEGGALDPASQIRANMQNLEIGDDYFSQAQDIDPDSSDEAELARRDELFKQALRIYQGVMRKDALMKCFAPALENANAALAVAKKKAGEAPSEKDQARIDKAQESIDEIEGFKTAFDENKDFDALVSFRIGACLISQNRPWEAFVAFNDILQNHKDFELLSTATYYYILALRAMGRDDEAQAECKKFIDTYKNDKEKSGELGRVALLMGQISYDKGDYKDAIAQLEWVKKNVDKMDTDVACQIDWFIISASFSRSPWGILNDSEKEYIKGIGKKGYKPKLSEESQKTMALIEDFLKRYGGKTEYAPVVEEMYYRRALLYFYSTMLPETISAFEDYMKHFPNGYFTPDARYRLAVVQNGVRPPETADVVRRCTNWIKDYFAVTDATLLDTTKVPEVREDIDANIMDSVRSQLPEVYTLLGDANKSLAEAVKGSDIRKGIGNKKIEKFTKSDLNKKQKFMDASIDAYILAAKSARYNPDALYFSLTELGKQLPQLENGYARLIDLYDTLYNWDPNAPEALNYLFKKIDYTVSKARVESAKMDRAERKKYQDAAQEETRKMMAEAILKNIDNPRQEGVEQLLDELARRVASNVVVHRIPKEGEIPPPRDPNEYTAEKAIDELLTLLNLKDETGATLIARARGSYARALIYDNLASNPRTADYARYVSERDRAYRVIANSYEPNELSPTILCMVGTYLLDHGNEKRAEEYFRYVLDFFRGAESAEFAFVGEGKILFDRKEYKKAYEIYSEGVDGNIAYMLESELRLGRAQSLIEMSDADAASLNIHDRLGRAAEELNYIKSVKEWRGRATAAALYYLGRINEEKREYEAAVGNYRLCYLTWKKYPEFAAKAMLRDGLILRDRLGQPEAAKTLFLQMTDTPGRFKNTPEGKEAAKLLQSM